ncbi:MAG: malonyl-ACP O-methyltransferase BioC [Candidatus Methylophosphatis roskildensis]
MKSSRSSEASVVALARSAFDRAATSYDAAAEFQCLICDRLVGLLPHEIEPALIADLGCGTGYTSRVLASRYLRAEILAIDFAPSMLDLARSRADAEHWIGADLQHLPLRANTVDLACSSLALQWCDPAQAFAEAARILRPGGVLAIASVGPGTLGELEHAFAGIDGHDHVIEFSDLASLEARVSAAGLRLTQAIEEPLTLHRPNLHSIVRELKAIGANTVGPRRRRGMLSRAGWQAVEQRYESLRGAAGLPVTYAALYLIATRP